MPGSRVLTGTISQRSSYTTKAGLLKTGINITSESKAATVTLLKSIDLNVKKRTLNISFLM